MSIEQSPNDTSKSIGQPAPEDIRAMVHPDRKTSPEETHLTTRGRKFGALIAIGTVLVGGAGFAGAKISESMSNQQEQNNDGDTITAPTIAPSETPIASPEPVSPSAIPPSETFVPAPTETAEPTRPAHELIPFEEMIFTNADGEIQTVEELQADIQIGPREFANPISSLEEFYQQMENMANYFPVWSDVRHNLNVPEGEMLTQDDVEANFAKYREMYSVLFQSPGGGMHSTMNLIAEQAHTRAMNLGADGSYKIKIQPNEFGTYFAVTDNADKSSPSDNERFNLGGYQVSGGTESFKVDVLDEAYEVGDMSVTRIHTYEELDPQYK